MEPENIKYYFKKDTALTTNEAISELSGIPG